MGVTRGGGIVRRRTMSAGRAGTRRAYRRAGSAGRATTRRAGRATTRRGSAGGRRGSRGGNTFKGGGGSGGSRRVRSLGSHLGHRVTRFSGFHGHARGRGTRVFSVKTEAVVRGVLPIVSGFRHKLTTMPRRRGSSTFIVNVSGMCGRVLARLSTVKIGPVRTLKGRFSPSLRGTIVRIRDRRCRPKAITRRLRGNCACGSGIIHRDVITMIDRWECFLFHVR